LINEKKFAEGIKNTRGRRNPKIAKDIINAKIGY